MSCALEVAERVKVGLVERDGAGEGEAGKLAEAQGQGHGVAVVEGVKAAVREWGGD